MPLDVACPRCQCVFPVLEARQPIGIECPRCEAELTAAFRNSPGGVVPEIRVTLGFPPTQTAYSDLGTRQESESKVNRRLSHKRGLMLGVLAVSLAVFLVSLGGLGATGYYLFTNLDHTDQADHANHDPAPSIPVPSKIDSGNSTPPSKPFELIPVKKGPPGFKVPNIPGNTMTLDLRQYGARVGAISVGGGGRYLVMHFPESGTLVVFDLAEARVHQKITIDKGDVKLAAGGTWLICYPPTAGRGVFQAFTLPNLDRRYETILDQFSDVTAIAMGNRTNGPLLAINSAGEVALFDIGANVIKEVDGSRQKPGIHTGFLRAVPDGTAFATFDKPYNRSVKVLTEVDRNWKVTGLNAAVVTPGADGNFYGNSDPMDRDGHKLAFTAGVNPLAGRVWFLPQITPRGGAFTQKGYLLKIVSDAPADAPKQSLTVTIHSAGNVLLPHQNTPTLSDQPEFDEMIGANGMIKPTIDEHFFLLLEAKLLAVLSGDRTKLVLRRLNI